MCFSIFYSIFIASLFKFYAFEWVLVDLLFIYFFWGSLEFKI